MEHVESVLLLIKKLALQGIALLMVKHTEAKRGFVVLPRRWVVERSFA